MDRFRRSPWAETRTLRVVKGTTLIEVTSADPLDKQKELVRVILSKLE
jgi:hypothetical protein